MRMYCSAFDHVHLLHPLGSICKCNDLIAPTVPETPFISCYIYLQVDPILDLLDMVLQLGSVGEGPASDRRRGFTLKPRFHCHLKC